MLLKAPIAVLVVSLFVAAARCESESLLPLVTGGTATVVGQAPYVVSIRRQSAIGETTNSYCSGTIVNANHVVTSATCVHDVTFNLINPFWFRIIAGDLNIIVPSFQRFTTRASHIYTHPDYRFNPPRNSVAVMRTLEPFPVPSNNIDFAVLNTVPLAIGHNCRFIGWGSQTNIGATLATQRWVNAPIIACGGATIDTNMFCAGSLTVTNPPSGVCAGNLGGGLFCDVNGWWEFTGILAGGIGCGDANVAGQYMQVRDFAPWINQQFTRTDATNPGIPVQAPAP
ncbi:brain-specific serine protease 4-like [Bradysia coprophila]|uniref:brain-specific serine protease 4-like n=1 Tax=Bradysia coprophila TaxID=38358 RepID=UPI00187D71E6|nr:brain-specific serine protease 4-like [Bradysia coprophila]